MNPFITLAIGFMGGWFAAKADKDDEKEDEYYEGYEPDPYEGLGEPDGLDK